MARTKRAKSKECSWSDMPYDLLLKIFSYLSIMDRMLNISMVCSSWRTACSDAVFSSTLDISEFKKSQDSQESDWRSQSQLIFWRGIHLGRHKLTKLVFDNEFQVEDRHLIYAAQRCPNLQELWLHIPYQTTRRGLESAFRHWRNLERMYISFFSRVPHVNIFEIVGERCPLLTELKICASYFDVQTALLIWRHVPGLKKLTLRCVLVTRRGMYALLNTMPHLDELHICVRNMEGVTKDGREMLPAIMHEERLVQKASRIPVYHACYSGECGTCPASTMATFPPHLD